MGLQIALQVVLSALILLVGLWLCGLAVSPAAQRRLLSDRAALMRVLALPSSRTILGEPINLHGRSPESLPFAPLIAAVSTARRREYWKTCALAALLAAALLAASCLFDRPFLYLGINAGLLLLSGVLLALGPGDDGDSVLPFARVLLQWQTVNPNGCRKFCNEERPDLQTLYETLLALPLDPGADCESPSETAGPPSQPGADVFYARADVYLQAGDLQSAIADCTQAIRLCPDHAEAHCRRGSAYLEAGDCLRAMADLVEAIRLKPDLAEAYYLRACAYLRIGKTDTAYGELQSAIADCSTAIRINPMYVEAYCRRGDLYLQINELHRALADYSHAMRLNPAFAEPYYRRGLEHQEKHPR